MRQPWTIPSMARRWPPAVWRPVHAPSWRRGRAYPIGPDRDERGRFIEQDYIRPQRHIEQLIVDLDGDLLAPLRREIEMILVSDAENA